MTLRKDDEYLLQQKGFTMNEKRYTPDLQLFAQEGVQNGSGETGENFADAEQNGTEQVDLDKEFSELISGKFKEQFTKKTQGIIDKRFKETKQLEDYKSRVSPAVNALMEKYGVEEGREDLLSGFLKDGADFNEEKETVEESENANLPHEREIRLRERVSSWVRESKEIKELYPDFDLRKELNSSKLFSRLVLSGAPVRAAYETVHKDEILSGAMAYTADKVREQVVRNIETKGRRPLENGISSESAVVTAVDVNSLSSKDILKILKQVENGANIKF
ncbi:MAG: hypothetical protein ACI4VW_09570 [Acutalibacteraceae bacterium]